MAIVYNTTVKNARLTVTRDAVDQGASFGKLVIGTSALSGATGVLATITLQDPSASVSGGVLTLAGTPLSAAATAAGTAAKAELRDSNDVVIASNLSVGTSATDIIINSTSIAVGQTVQVSSGTITHG